MQEIGAIRALCMIEGPWRQRWKTPENSDASRNAPPMHRAQHPAVDDLEEMFRTQFMRLHAMDSARAQYLLPEGVRFDAVERELNLWGWSPPHQENTSLSLIADMEEPVPRNAASILFSNTTIQELIDGTGRLRMPGATSRPAEKEGVA